MEDAKVALAVAIWACVAGSLVLSSEAGAAAVTLVSNGTPAASIVLGKEPTRSAQFAAYELQYHLKKITGAELPIVTDEAEVTGPRLLVGESEATAALGLPGKPFNSQEYLIRFLPDALVLMGNDADDRTEVNYDEDDVLAFRTWPDFFTEHATCYAVYDFLERFCGVRWFRPGELGMLCPRKQTLEVQGYDVRRSPEFKYRQPTWVLGNSEGYDRATGLWNYQTDEDKVAGVYELAYPEMAKWPHGWRDTHAMRSVIRLFLHRMRCGGEPYACNHSFYGYYQRFWEKSADPKEAEHFIEKRPEWFAQGYEGQPPQMCYSNEGFIQQVIQDARDYFDGKGKMPVFRGAGDYFALEPMDNNRWCKCPDCQALLLPEATRGKGQFSNNRASDYLFSFANKVAREVAKTHPDKFLSTLAYWSHAYRPEKVKLEPNISVGLCLHMRNVYSPTIQENDVKLLKDWAENEPGRRFFLFLYYCFPVANAISGNFHCFPGFFAHGIDRWFKIYHEYGIRGAFFDGFGQDVEAYVTFKLMDDATQDVEALLDEYFTGMYGGAAGPMKAMYLRIEDIYCNPDNYPPGFAAHQNRHIAWEHLGTEEHMEELGGLMAQAKAAAQTDLEKARVALFEKQVWEYMTVGRREYLERKKVAIPAVKVPRLPDAGGDAAKVDWTKAAVLSQWHKKEGGPADKKLEVRLAHDGTFFYWQLTEWVDPKSLKAAGNIWSGDDWEIFLAKQRARPYRQLGLNPTGMWQGLAHGEADGKWDSGIAVVSDTSAPDRWTARVALPLEKLLPGGVEPSEKFYANFVRLWREGRLVRQVTWSPRCGVHEVDRLGEIVLEK